MRCCSSWEEPAIPRRLPAAVMDAVAVAPPATGAAVSAPTDQDAVVVAK